MRRLMWRAVVLALCAMGCGGPSEPSNVIDGTWLAIGVGHSDTYGLSLDASGETVSGEACYLSSGFLVFGGAPVRGKYPNVHFVVTTDAARPCCAGIVGRTFTGRLDDTGDIVGSFGEVPLRFKRSSAGRCEGGR